MVYRPAQGPVVACAPGVRRGPWSSVRLSQSVLDAYRVETGDLVVGVVADDEMTELRSLNGLVGEAMLDRPRAGKRSSYERSAPDRRIPVQSGPHDATGRLLDLSAPFALGTLGVVYGPHGSGMTRTLQSMAAAVMREAPDVHLMVLLARVRREEETDWRRRLPGVETVTCPSAEDDATADDAVMVAECALGRAQRLSEAGLDVVLVIDSLTAVWAAMLETEDADAQQEADLSGARLRIREWAQAAGWFRGEGLFGGGAGGSLTLLASAWQIPVDDEEEEEHESHPHLRLFEHLLDGLTWRMPLSGRLAGMRLFPALDWVRGSARQERGLLDADTADAMDEARRLAFGVPEERLHHAAMAALEADPTETGSARALAGLLALERG